ncbi:MAG: serine hydrolase domain-containing protein [Leucobacter sp.]
MTDPSVAPFDAALAEAFDAHPRHTAPAVLAALFDPNGIVAWRASGDPRSEGTVTTRSTVFRIASMSKSFLAAAALALRDEGVLDLDRSISEYVPGARFLLNGHAHEVTVEELLSNNSGMPEDNAWGDRQLGASRDAIMSLARAGFRLTARPGERYQYSNLGMSLVGRAIESVTGSLVEDVIRERFFAPLGLLHTHYSSDEYSAQADIAHGFRSFDEGASFLREPFVGSGALSCIGGIFSTIDDIAAWAWFLASAFTDDPVQPALLSERSRREMQRAHTGIPITPSTPQRAINALGYGLGLVIENDVKFGQIVSHSGGLPGFSSHMRWHVASGIGAVVFGNSDAFTAEKLASATLDAHLHAAPQRAILDTVWPETLRAAERIDGVLAESSTIADASDVCADNLFMDIPAAHRDHQFSVLRAETGQLLSQRPLAERVLVATDAAHLKWRIDCERGALTCEIRMVGVNAPTVQSLTLNGDPADPFARTASTLLTPAREGAYPE